MVPPLGYSEIWRNDEGQLTMTFLGDEDAAPIRMRIIADSITDGGCRLITAVADYWRGVHSEMLTHRVFSRNSASSRAIPAATLRKRTLAAPAMPVHWGQNQKGMQASSEVGDIEQARNWWLRGLAAAAALHEEGEQLGLHKQIVNRVIEPWMMISVIISATDWANFFHLRKHGDAEPTVQKAATLMWELFHNSLPTPIAPGGWHIPFIDSSDIQWAQHTNQLLQLSVGRCARVSYLTHDGKRDRDEDIVLHDRLAKTASEGTDPMHASPFEHQARALPVVKTTGTTKYPTRAGNFEGWLQYRKLFDHEAGPDTRDRCHRCGCWAGRHVTNCPNGETK